MKLSIRLWLDDKKSLVEMIFSLALYIIFAITNAKQILYINLCITDLSNLKTNIWILLFFSAVSGFSIIACNLIRPRAVRHAMSTAYKNYEKVILDADYEMFTKYSTSRIISLTDFINRWGNISKNSYAFIQCIISIIIYLGSVYMIAGSTAIAIAMVYLIGAAIINKLYKLYEKSDKREKELKLHINQEFENIVNGFAEVRLFNMQKTHMKRMVDDNDEMYVLRLIRNKINFVVNGTITIIDLIGLFAIILYSANQVSLGLITTASALTIVMYIERVMDPLITILDIADSMSSDLSMAVDFQNILDFKNSYVDGKTELDSFEEAIEIKDVSFSYAQSSKVLKHLDMTIEKGKHIGICGISGGGKSTLLKILNKFYNVENGQILIDGININDISAESLRKHIACVQQENIMFPGSIMENIVYGNPNVTEYEIIEACKKAKIYDFIMSQKDRFDTIVGPRGIKLSGGQRQRIALTRIFLGNPDIIILDEATSALDNETEKIVQDAISGLAGKTIITVAHRLTTIKNSDCIYVMKGGSVIEKGTHEELMKLKGAYSKMYLCSEN